MDKNYLQHYGVQGMRWGVRRYENKDGSLTELGKKHYGTKENYKKKTEAYDNYWLSPQNNGKDKPKSSRQEQVFNKSRNATESARDIARTGSKYSRRPQHPELKGMSNEEIQKAINRMDLERRYSSLKDGDFKSGWEKAGDILEVAGNVMSIATAAAGVYMIIKNQPELCLRYKLRGDDMNELYHHGILGQQWGKRNGPPYPLDASDHSAREKNAGWRKSIDKGSETTKTKKGLSDKQKKAIIIGASVVAAGLAAYGIYKYKSIPKSNPLTPEQMKELGFQVFEYEKFEPERIHIDTIDIPTVKVPTVEVPKVKVETVEVPKVKDTAEKLRSLTSKFSKDTNGYTKIQKDTLNDAKERLSKAIQSGNNKDISSAEWLYNYVKNAIDKQNKNFESITVTPEMIKDAERLGIDVRDLVVQPLAMKG